MNITVYLPDELGARAKAENLKLSRLLRDAVEDELRRRDAMAATLENVQTYELQLKDSRTGEAYKGRVTGKLIDETHNARDDFEVYLTADGRVLVYDANGLRYDQVEEPETELAYFPDALIALGIEPVIDL